MHRLDTRRILVGVGGSIAAFRACDLVRDLRGLGANVKVAPTKAATAFVSALTFEALSGNSVMGGSLEVCDGKIPHIEEAYAADACVIAPASADLIAKMANGIADEGLLCTLLSVRAPVIVAPAMETRMWDHPATQANVETLKSRGVTFVGPVAGPLASGRSGKGRLSPIVDVVEATLSALTPDSLAGRRVLVTAGPTVEDVDPVRYLTNRSTGKMGVAIGRAAAHRGADVELVHGPLATTVPTLSNLRATAVRSAQEMHEVCLRVVESGAPPDVAIFAAAVADYRPADVADQKLKKEDGALEAIALSRTPDILATVGAHPKRPPVVVGFAAETENVVDNARGKLARKNADLIVANDVSAQDAGFQSDTNRVVLVDKSGENALELMSKDATADGILDAVERLLG